MHNSPEKRQGLEEYTGIFKQQKKSSNTDQSVPIASAEGRRKVSKAKRHIESVMYDRLFSIYLTPKALDDIKVKHHEFAKVVNETSKKYKRKELLNNSVEYRSNQNLPDLVPASRNTVQDSQEKGSLP